MKIEIERMEDKWVFGIYVEFRGWITIDLPYRKINIMSNKVYNEMVGLNYFRYGE